MPSANPPVDAADAETAPEFVLPAYPPVEIRVGERRECATRPDPTAFRYVIVRTSADGRRFQGYLWEVPAPT